MARLWRKEITQRHSVTINGCIYEALLIPGQADPHPLLPGSSDASPHISHQH